MKAKIERIIEKAFGRELEKPASRSWSFSVGTTEAKDAARKVAKRAGAEIAKLVGAELAAKEVEIRRLRNICVIKDEVAEELQERYLSYEAQLAKMREALELAHQYQKAMIQRDMQRLGINRPSDPWITVEELDRARAKATDAREKALAAIPEEPEMMRLLRWIVQGRAEVPMFDWMGRGLTAEYAQYSYIIRHIEREFGYKLDDENPKP